MKKIWIYLSMILGLLFATYGCGADTVVTDEAEIIVQQDETEEIYDVQEELTDTKTDESETEILEETQEASEEDVEEDAEVLIDEDGSYISRDEVALYIHTYGKLPKNFITKQEAEELGWISQEGNLDEVAPGMSIGGNKFGNYEQQLPDGKYKECDINYTGGYRGDERIVYSEDGNIYYTDDHYATFTQLYSSEE